MINLNQMAYNIHEPGDIPQRKEGSLPIDMKLQQHGKEYKKQHGRVIRIHQGTN